MTETPGTSRVLGWVILPIQIAFGIALGAVATRILHAIGIVG